jgi:YVTN family beta-propeller protein
VNAPTFPASFTLTATFRVTVTTNFTTTITNTARLISAQTPLTSSNPVTHPVRGTQLAHVYLPIIFKNFTPGSAALSWISQSQDVVREVDGSNPQAFVADGRNDGAFMLTVSTGSEGPKTVANVRLVSSQGASAQWDTLVNTVPVLGIFNGGTRLNNADGTVSQTINGQIIVTIYASDNQVVQRFPPDTYDYTVFVTFTDGTSVSATARIPAPPPPVCYINKVADIRVGNDPRGVVVDESHNRAYVANFGSNSVSVVDTGSNTVITTVTGITAANGITLDPARNIVWVTNYSANQVTPINASTGAALTPVAVGSGPWGVTFANNRVYVVNNLGNSVTVIDAISRTVVATLSGNFNRPYHIAANPVTGKVYVPNFGNHTVSVISGTTVSSVNLAVGDPSTQPYGVAVDETRNVVYVATVDSHRVVAIGTLNGVPDQLLGWAAFHRGYFNPVPHRPVPMRAIAVNPDIGPMSPMDDGGHVWTTTSTGDGSEANQTLLIPKGWISYFHSPLPCDVGINPTEGIAIHRGLDRAYVTSGASPGTLTVFNDNPTPPLVPFSASESSDPITFEIFKVE